MDRRDKSGVVVVPVGHSEGSTSLCVKMGGAKEKIGASGLLVGGKRLPYWACHDAVRASGRVPKDERRVGGRMQSLASLGDVLNEVLGRRSRY